MDLGDGRVDAGDAARCGGGEDVGQPQPQEGAGAAGVRRGSRQKRPSALLAGMAVGAEAEQEQAAGASSGLAPGAKRHKGSAGASGGGGGPSRATVVRAAASQGGQDDQSGSWAGGSLGPGAIDTDDEAGAVRKRGVRKMMAGPLCSVLRLSTAHPDAWG